MSAIAVPSGPPKMIRSSRPASDEAHQRDEHDRDDPRLPERPRLDPVVGAVDRLDHRAHRAARGPDRAGGADDERDHRRALRRLLLQRVDRLQHVAGRDRGEELLQRLVGPDQVEQADEEDHRGEEREQRAEGDLRGQAHRVVGQERLERPLEGLRPTRGPRAARGSTALCPTRRAQRSRPLRARKRIVAPIPPARKKPAPSAPAATTGSLAAQLAGDVGRVAELRQLLDAQPRAPRARRSISRRTTSGVRPFVASRGHCPSPSLLPLLSRRAREQPEDPGDREEARA